MTFDCPQCQASLTAGEEWAGDTLTCPCCGQPMVLAPQSSSGTAKPPARVAPAPAAGSSGRFPGGRPFRTLSIALLLLLASFTVYRLRQTPPEAWHLVVALGHDLIFGVPPHPPTIVVQMEPAPTTAITTPPPPASATPLAAAPKPVPPPQDPLEWLVAHRSAWPKQVTLRVDTAFPILNQGKVVGSGIVPAGDSVSLLDIDFDARKVVVSSPAYGGGKQTVRFRATNLRDLAKLAYENSQPAALPIAAPPPPAASTPAPTPSEVAETSPDLFAPDPLAPPPLPSSGPGPSLTIAVDHPILLLQTGAQGKNSTHTNFSVLATNFTPNRYSWTQVADRINPLNASGTVTFSANDSAAASSTQATFSAPGVYQIHLVATDGTNSAVRNTYVQVWDSTPVLNPGKIGAYPDITPPPSVRNLSPDPGPFQHPRVLFTNSDWPEVSGRDTNSALGKIAVAALRKVMAKTLDDATTPVGHLAQQLDAYAQSGYSGTPPDLSGVMLSDPSGVNCLLQANPKNIYSMLLVAGYLGWIEQDPKTPNASIDSARQERGRYLARVTAALAHVHFAAEWNRTTGVFNLQSPIFTAGLDKPGHQINFDMAPALLPLCYDFLYRWMTDPQRQDVRDFLYALSYGRHYSNAFNNGKPNDGLNQNGDFGNLNDFGILLQMAVEGEESAVSPEVKTFFGTPQSADAEKWMQPSDAGDTSAWPGSTVASVDNLQRQLNMINQWFISPWGFTYSNLAYLGLSTTSYIPAALAMGHRGENPFVTSYLYNGAMADFYTLQPSDGANTCPLISTKIYAFDHHDGGRGRPTVYFFWKYMYPDDPMVDYVYRTYLPSIFRDGEIHEPLLAAMFGLDPGIDGKIMPLENIAAVKKLPLLKFDPQRGVVIARNGWKDSDLNIWFDDGFEPHPGHCHAERNSFSLFALGRVWSFAPGYHCTISDLQTSILIQDPKLMGDAASQGYIGASPSSATQEPPYPGDFPPLPGQLLEVSQSANNIWSIIAGDATIAYDAGRQGGRGVTTSIGTGRKASSFMYPGFMDFLNSRSPIYQHAFDQEIKVSTMDYNPVQHAIRTLLFSRGEKPYVLCVDDFQKDDSPHNYRWSMNSATGFGTASDNRFLNAAGRPAYSSVAIEPKATPTEAVLYHSPIDDGNQPGLPRLLVRDISEQTDGDQPAMALESKPPNDPATSYLTYGIDNNHVAGGIVKICSNRLLIERDNIVDPHYKILFFPFRTGDALPQVRWSSDHSEVQIDLRNGTVDTIKFTPNADHRTRLSVSRESSA